MQEMSNEVNREIHSFTELTDGKDNLSFSGEGDSFTQLHDFEAETPCVGLDCFLTHLTRNSAD